MLHRGREETLRAETDLSFPWGGNRASESPLSCPGWLLEEGCQPLEVLLPRQLAGTEAGGDHLPRFSASISLVKKQSSP